MARLEDITNVGKLGYEFGQQIGKGCYGKVFKAKFFDEVKNDEIDLACKYIIKKKCPKDFLTKFLPRELEILKHISHPFIIKTHSILQSHASIFIFMRFCENGDLLDFVKKEGPQQEFISKVWFFQLACAIHYLHSLKIAHRDLKCENILISKNKNLKIADFGFARRATDDFETRTKMITLSKTYCGSAAYAPPEIVSGTPYDIMKVDVWSLGVILLILLNGTMPFDDSNISKLVNDQKNRSYTTNSDIMKTLSRECLLMIHSCLEPNPNLRLTSREILLTPWLKCLVDKYSAK